jgi:hypothetical protein
LSQIYDRFVTNMGFPVVAPWPKNKPMTIAIMHTSPQTAMIIDTIVENELELRSLMDTARGVFVKYHHPPPPVPQSLGDYVPCRVLIQTHWDKKGHVTGHIRFSRSDRVNYDAEWMISNSP